MLSSTYPVRPPGIEWALGLIHKRKHWSLPTFNFCPNTKTVPRFRLTLCKNNIHIVLNLLQESFSPHCGSIKKRELAMFIIIYCMNIIKFMFSMQKSPRVHSPPSGTHCCGTFYGGQIHNAESMAVNSLCNLQGLWYNHQIYCNFSVLPVFVN